MPRFSLRPVDLTFLDTAPKRWSFDARLGAPPDAVFAAIADPATWKRWFPGMTSGHYLNATRGVGAVRQARQGPAVYVETIIAWDTPHRWVYRVDETSVPMARALVEEWLVEPAGAGSLVRWRFAIDPRALFVAVVPVATWGMGSIFRRAMRNLDRALSRKES